MINIMKIIDRYTNWDSIKNIISMLIINSLAG